MKWFFFSLILSARLFSSEPLGEGIFVDRNSQPESSKPRIAIATVIIQDNRNIKRGELTYGQQVAFGTRSKQLYAKKHGYDFFIATEKLCDCFGVKTMRQLEPSWSKLPLISQIIDDYDWVFLTDADSIILNFDILLESFLDEKYDFIACSENYQIFTPCHYCPEIRCINAGQFFVKNSTIGKEILLGAWEKQLIPAPDYEQPWVNNYIVANGLQDQVLVYPYNAFNSHHTRYKEGEFLVHMYGIFGQDMAKEMQIFGKKYAHSLKEEEKKILQKN